MNTGRLGISVDAGERPRIQNERLSEFRRDMGMGRADPPHNAQSELLDVAFCRFTSAVHGTISFGNSQKCLEG
jgi:hypothetical protein